MERSGGYRHRAIRSLPDEPHGPVLRHPGHDTRHRRAVRFGRPVGRPAPGSPAGPWAGEPTGWPPTRVRPEGVHGAGGGAARRRQGVQPVAPLHHYTGPPPGRHGFRQHAGWESQRGFHPLISADGSLVGDLDVQLRFRHPAIRRPLHSAGARPAPLARELLVLEGSDRQLRVQLFRGPARPAGHQVRLPAAVVRSLAVPSR